MWQDILKKKSALDEDELRQLSLDKLIEMTDTYGSSKFSNDDRRMLRTILDEKIVDVILAINPQAKEGVVGETRMRIGILISYDKISSKKEMDDWLDKNYGTPKRDKNYEQYLMAQAAKRKPKNKKRRGRY